MKSKKITSYSKVVDFIYDEENWKISFELENKEKVNIINSTK